MTGLSTDKTSFLKLAGVNWMTGEFLGKRAAKVVDAVRRRPRMTDSSMATALDDDDDDDARLPAMVARRWLDWV